MFRSPTAPALRTRYQSPRFLTNDSDGNKKVLVPVYTQSLDYCKRSRRGPAHVRFHPRAARVVHNSVLLRNEHPNADIHISRVELG